MDAVRINGVTSNKEDIGNRVTLQTDSDLPTNKEKENELDIDQEDKDADKNKDIVEIQAPLKGYGFCKVYKK